MNAKLNCGVVFISLAIAMSFAAAFLPSSGMIMMGVVCSLTVGSIFLVYGLLADFEKDFAFYIGRLRSPDRAARRREATENHENADKD
ncbi:MAG: hypothetical protein ACRC46_05120 [Thermoguttaceae bacterium]